jgi:hypothetical protein
MDKFLEHLEKLDAWLERDEGGSIPADLLQERGLTLPHLDTMDDAALHEKLWETIRAMSGIGLYLDFTDHLSDRELYARLCNDVLVTETFLDPEDPDSGAVVQLVNCGTDEDDRIYLTYYADEETRKDWSEDFGIALPPVRPLPFDRDRLLPSIEARAAECRYKH